MTGLVDAVRWIATFSPIIAAAMALSSV